MNTELPTLMGFSRPRPIQSRIVLGARPNISPTWATDSMRGNPLAAGFLELGIRDPPPDRPPMDKSALVRCTAIRTTEHRITHDER